MKKVINELAVATATVVTSIAIAVAAHYVVAILDLFVQQPYIIKIRDSVHLNQQEYRHGFLFQVIKQLKIVSSKLIRKIIHFLF